MKEIYSIFIKAASTNWQAEIEMEVNSLEELDIILANNFNNYQELKSYIIHKSSNIGPHRPYTPYPKIKLITKDKHQYTEYLTPIFEIINQEKIIELCKDAIANKEKFKTKKEDIRIIYDIINQKEISYRDIRECSFALKRIGYSNVRERVIERNSEYDIEKYIKKPNNKTKKRTNNLHFL